MMMKRINLNIPRIIIEDHLVVTKLNIPRIDMMIDTMIHTVGMITDMDDTITVIDHHAVMVDERPTITMTATVINLVRMNFPHTTVELVTHTMTGLMNMAGQEADTMTILMGMIAGLTIIMNRHDHEMVEAITHEEVCILVSMIPLTDSLISNSFDIINLYQLFLLQNITCAYLLELMNSLSHKRIDVTRNLNILISFVCHEM